MRRFPGHCRGKSPISLSGPPPTIQKCRVCSLPRQQENTSVSIVGNDIDTALAYRHAVPSAHDALCFHCRTRAVKGARTVRVVPGYGRVTRNLESGIRLLKDAASGERGAGKGAPSGVVAASTHRRPERAALREIDELPGCRRFGQSGPHLQPRLIADWEGRFGSAIIPAGSSPVIQVALERENVCPHRSKNSKHIQAIYWMPSSPCENGTRCSIRCCLTQNCQSFAGPASKPRGFLTLRNSLFLSCAQDIAKLAVDSDERTPSIKNLVANIQRDQMNVTLQRRFSEWVVPSGEEKDPEIVEALKRMELCEWEQRCKQFEELVAKAAADWQTLQSDPALDGFQKIRDKVSAHTEIKCVADKYQFVDIGALGIKWPDMKRLIDDMQSLVEVLGLVIRNAGFSWDMLDSQLARASESFWQPNGT